MNIKESVELLEVYLELDRKPVGVKFFFHEDEFNNVDTRFVEAMQTELPPETLKQAKAMYLNLMAKMNDKNIS